MLKKLKSSNKGFTIIEVLIVLAIAALILLIVFLAVPALQRSSRNTQRKNDASAIAGAVANFISNNSGSLPDSVSDGNTGDTTVVDVSKGTSGNTERAKLGFYVTKGNVKLASATNTNDGGVWVNTVTATITPTAVAPGGESQTKVSTNSVLVVFGQDCTPTVNARTAAIYYVTESGSGNGNIQCVEQ